jgi:hypothetical protein
MIGYSVEPTFRMVQRLLLPPPTLLTLILTVLVTYGPILMTGKWLFPRGRSVARSTPHSMPGRQPV